jgi:hypothetical protein
MFFGFQEAQTSPDVEQASSMPGAFLGVMPMDHVSHALGVQVNHWLTISVGAPLMGIAMTLVLEDRITQLLGV